MEGLSSLGVWAPIFDFAGSMPSWPPAGIALFWIATLLAVWLLYRGVKTAMRIISALYFTAVHRLRTRLANVKTWIVCRLRSVIPHRRSTGVTQGPVLEFEETDLAVLRLTAAQGPGEIVSATDFADRLSMRPRQVQKHLDQLRHAKMVESVAGSTRGYGNYRLTPYGMAFLVNITRQSQGSVS